MGTFCLQIATLTNYALTTWFLQQARYKSQTVNQTLFNLSISKYNKPIKKSVMLKDKKNYSEIFPKLMLSQTK
jgi:hypothetical protein